MDIHEDAPKLDAEYVVLLKLKRLSRIRHARYKVWVGGYSLIYLPLQEVSVYKHSLILDTEEVA